MLSCGHSSLTLYLQLFLSGYGLELEDIEQLRTWGSKTPGHPEYGHTVGVEITTGPLGQGLAAAVGMAMAARRERGLFDPDAAPGESTFDHYIYVIASDGDIEEGVTSEASSLAGTQELGNLVVFYDDNEISIEDDTKIALSEDTAARYEAYGWHVQTVNGGEDVVGILDAIEAAKAEAGRPSLIVLRTVIGYPAPNKMNTGAAHGSALGADEVAAVKEALGFDPQSPSSWNRRCSNTPVRWWPAARPRTRSGSSPSTPGGRPTHPGPRCSIASSAGSYRRVGRRSYPPGSPTRRAWRPARPPAKCSARSARYCPSCGVARRTSVKATSPRSRAPTRSARRRSPPKMWNAQPYGRTLHFGVREHAMGAILNGIVLHGPTRALRRHVPDLLRLHAPGGPAGRADEGADDLRLDPRLDRPGRGRPHPPAGRAAGRAAGDPGPGRGAARPMPTRPRAAWKALSWKSAPGPPAWR